MKKDTLRQHIDDCLLDRFTPHYLLGNVYLIRDPLYEHN